LESDGKSLAVHLSPANPSYVSGETCWKNIQIDDSEAEHEDNILMIESSCGELVGVDTTDGLPTKNDIELMESTNVTRKMDGTDLNALD